MGNIRVKKNEENPESPEVLAESIVRIADAFDKLMSGPLTQKGIIVLLRAMPGMQMVGVRECTLVLENLKRLKGYYIRKS